MCSVGCVFASMCLVVWGRVGCEFVSVCLLWWCVWLGVCFVCVVGNLYVWLRDCGCLCVRVHGVVCLVVCALGGLRYVCVWLWVVVVGVCVCLCMWLCVVV